MTKKPSSTARQDVDHPSAPAILPNHVLYAHNDKSGKMYAVSLVSVRAMRRVVDILMECQGVTFVNALKKPIEGIYQSLHGGVPAEVRIGDIRVGLRTFDEVMAHKEPNPDEPFRLSESYEKHVRAFALGGMALTEEPRPVAGHMSDSPAEHVNVAEALVDVKTHPGGRREITKVHKPPRPAPEKPEKRPSALRGPKDDVADKLASFDRDGLTKLAKRNGFWKDDYDKLDKGRHRMVIGNVIRGRVKKGEAIKW